MPLSLALTAAWTLAFSLTFTLTLASRLLAFACLAAFLTRLSHFAAPLVQLPGRFGRLPFGRLLLRPLL